MSAVADRNYLYAVGGFSSSGAVDMVERFDPKETRWKRIASMHSKRGSAGGAAFNEKVFIFGGHSNDSYPCQMYDPAVDAWLSFANSAGPRITGFSSAVSFKGKIFVCSFVEDKINEMSLQMYDPDRNAWESCMGISCVDIPLFLENAEFVVYVYQERCSIHVMNCFHRYYFYFPELISCVIFMY